MVVSMLRGRVRICLQVIVPFYHGKQVEFPCLTRDKVARFVIGSGKAQNEDRLLSYFNNCVDKYATTECPNCIEMNLLGNCRYIMTRDAKHIKAVLTGNFADFGKGQLFHDLWSPFLGDSIFTTDGKLWSESRNLIRPMFTKNRISDLEIFERHAETMIGLFGAPGTPFDLMELFYRMTLDVTTEFLLGSGTNSLENPKVDFAHAFTEVQRIQMLVTTIGYGGSLLLCDKFHS